MAKKVADMTLGRIVGAIPDCIETVYCTIFGLVCGASGRNQRIARQDHCPNQSYRQHGGGGLAGKPTVDILVEVDIDAEMDAIAGTLQEGGWALMAEQTQPYEGKSFAKGYAEQGFAEKVYHLHLRRSGDWPELYVFRLRLRAHRDVAMIYELLKHSLGEAYQPIAMRIRQERRNL